VCTWYSIDNIVHLMPQYDIRDVEVAESGRMHEKHKEHGEMVK